MGVQKSVGKLIVHVGPPKTGTTALQRTLFASRHTLIDNAVLYPEPRRENAYNHGDLCATFIPYQDAPRMMRKRTEAEYTQLGEEFSQSLRSQIDELQPETIILSSEWLARAYNAPDAQKLFSFLDSLGAEQVEILLYARRPSAFFLSASQQRLRAAAQFAPIFEWNVNGLIKGFQERCPSYTLTARSFDHKAWLGAVSFRISQNAISRNVEVPLKHRV